jgi:hypothetical protein
MYQYKDSETETLLNLETQTSEFLKVKLVMKSSISNIEAKRLTEVGLFNKIYDLCQANNATDLDVHL